MELNNEINEMSEIMEISSTVSQTVTPAPAKNLHVITINNYPKCKFDFSGLTTSTKFNLENILQINEPDKVTYKVTSICPEDNSFCTSTLRLYNSENTSYASDVFEVYYYENFSYMNFSENYINFACTRNNIIKSFDENGQEYLTSHSIIDIKEKTQTTGNSNKCNYSIYVDISQFANKSYFTGLDINLYNNTYLQYNSSSYSYYVFSDNYINKYTLTKDDESIFENNIDVEKIEDGITHKTNILEFKINTTNGTIANELKRYFYTHCNYDNYHNKWSIGEIINAEIYDDKLNYLGRIPCTPNYKLRNGDGDFYNNVNAFYFVFNDFINTKNQSTFLDPNKNYNIFISLGHPYFPTPEPLKDNIGFCFSIFSETTYTLSSDDDILKIEYPDTGKTTNFENSKSHYNKYVYNVKNIPIIKGPVINTDIQPHYRYDPYSKTYAHILKPGEIHITSDKYNFNVKVNGQIKSTNKSYFDTKLTNLTPQVVNEFEITILDKNKNYADVISKASDNKLFYTLNEVATEEFKNVGLNNNSIGFVEPKNDSDKFGYIIVNGQQYSPSYQQINDMMLRVNPNQNSIHVGNNTEYIVKIENNQLCFKQYISTYFYSTYFSTPKIAYTTAGGGEKYVGESYRLEINITETSLDAKYQTLYAYIVNPTNNMCYMQTQKVGSTTYTFSKYIESSFGYSHPVTNDFWPKTTAGPTDAYVANNEGTVSWGKTNLQKVCPGMEMKYNVFITEEGKDTQHKVCEQTAYIISVSVTPKVPILKGTGGTGASCTTNVRDIKFGSVSSEINLNIHEFNKGEIPTFAIPSCINKKLEGYDKNGQIKDTSWQMVDEAVELIYYSCKTTFDIWRLPQANVGKSEILIKLKNK